MSPQISIIVPIYNVEKYLRQCIESIINQNNLDYELILVDDGSPDSCPRIIDEYANNNSRIKAIHKENGGVSSARNRGIAEASGDYLYFVDSDDWLVENKLSQALEIAVKKDVDILFCDCFEAYENGSYKRLHLFSERFIFSKKKNIETIQKTILCHKFSPFYSKGADSAYPAPWSKIFKSSLIKDNSIQFDSTLMGVYDDGLFTISALQKADKIAYSGICTYYYRILNSSIVHSFKDGMVEKFEKNCFAIDHFIKNNCCNNSLKQAEYARRVAYLSSFLTSYYFNEENKNTKTTTNKELISTFSRSPWKEGIANANYKNLELKHKFTLFFMRTHFIPGLKLYSFLKKKYKNK